MDYHFSPKELVQFSPKSKYSGLIGYVEDVVEKPNGVSYVVVIGNVPSDDVEADESHVIQTVSYVTCKEDEIEKMGIAQARDGHYIVVPPYIYSQTPQDPDRLSVLNDEEAE